MIRGRRAWYSRAFLIIRRSSAATANWSVYAVMAAFWLIWSYRRRRLRSSRDMGLLIVSSSMTIGGFTASATGPVVLAVLFRVLWAAMSTR
jgi:hypothetical protein